MFNKIIANSLPYMPHQLVWLFSKRYVAGDTLNDAIQISKDLNEKGINVTVDLLGEFIRKIEQAAENKNNYLQIVDQFVSNNIKGTFSIKPTSFGLLIDQEKCYQFVREVVQKAKDNNRFVRIDMEDSKCTNREFELFLRLKEDFPTSVGIVVQAYLHRTNNDIDALIKKAHSKQSPLNIRLCKGIYVEPESLAYQGYQEVRKQYLSDLELMLKNGVFAAIATHDKFLVDGALELISKYKVSKADYEFQMLYGVTPHLRNNIVAAGHPMRVYVPYGKDWFGYCSRRIKENPKMVKDIVKAIFVRG